MRRYELQLARSCPLGFLVWFALLIPYSEEIRGSAVVLQAKNKLAEHNAESQAEATSNGAAVATGNFTKSLYTGIPQIDYVLDPNLPRELNGHNLTDYPFYNAVPEEIDFKCDGLHDGFYASVPHKCQVYHHCLFGTRFDFLCANYTAFDQKTFICHFVSEVDCDNSPKYYKRNEALYKEASTTTTSTTTHAPMTTTTTTSEPLVQSSRNGGGTRHGGAIRRRRPHRRRRPMYDYYYDEEEYGDVEYYDDDPSALNHRRTSNRKQNKDSYDNHGQESESAEYDAPNEQIKPAVRSSNSAPSSSVYDRPRTPPKIRRPVPKSERNKWDYAPVAKTTTLPSVSSTQTPVEKPSTQPSPKKGTTMAQPPQEDEYYEDDEEYEYEDFKSDKSKHSDYDFPTGFEDPRRYPSRHRSRQPVRKRIETFDDYDINERSRTNRRKEHTRYEERPRGRPMHRNKNRHDDHPPHSGHKKRVMDSDYRRRPEKYPLPEEDYYYEEEEEEEVTPKRNRRPLTITTKKPKSSSKFHTKIEHTENKAVVEATTKNAKFTNAARTSKANDQEHETHKDNEIPTTEIASDKTTMKYKTVKIVNNSIREDVEDEFVPTEETKFTATQSKPAAIIVKTDPSPKFESRRPVVEPLRKNITTIRHFVVMAPIRKPSHLNYNPGNTREEVTMLPELRQQQDFYGPATYIKLPVPYTNQSYPQTTSFGTFYMPVEQVTKVKPIEEHFSDNSNGLGYNNAFISGQPNHYTSGERLYTHSVLLPHRPPANFDITAPGPSAGAEEITSQDKKYSSNVPTYTANADYDLTYNDALQPSTLHPVQRYSSTQFYLQTQPRRHHPEYAFKERAFTMLNRSQSHYTK